MIPNPQGIPTPWCGTPIFWFPLDLPCSQVDPMAARKGDLAFKLDSTTVTFWFHESESAPKGGNRHSPGGGATTTVQGGRRSASTLLVRGAYQNCSQIYFSGVGESLRSCVALLARGAAYLKKKGFGIASIFGQGLAALIFYLF
ncbi:hypothetical protein POM88_042043 [Heracleum sosnowskyi]|uniref:Uncharacterized protein n=1 Tax=Heracleum sosnowskyi TaxID=360622 RepID=A0AAD8MBA1_9APIA|nr:hypothetical protein POM88_042043 [Heracleum sosnowskyi]